MPIFKSRITHMSLTAISRRVKLRYRKSILSSKSMMMDFAMFDYAVASTLSKKRHLKLAFSFLEFSLFKRFNAPYSSPKLSTTVNLLTVAAPQYSVFSVKDFCFKLNSFLMFFLEERHTYLRSSIFVSNLLSHIINDLITLVITKYKVLFPTSADAFAWRTNFIARVTRSVLSLIKVTTLTPNALSVLFYNSLINRILSSLQRRARLPFITASTLKPNLLHVVLPYKFKKLFNSSYKDAIAFSVSPTLSSSIYPLNKFLVNYIRSRRRRPFLPKFKFFRFKRNRFFNRRYRRDPNSKIHFGPDGRKYHKLTWYKRRRIERFKLLMNRRQFVFLFF